MPYIKSDLRPRIDELIEKLFEASYNEGELNYVISRICHRYILQVPILDRNYALFNSVMGVLECAKLELYDIVVSVYEDKKREQNGPVSKLELAFDESRKQCST